MKKDFIRLRLALLKERADYRTFWETYGGKKITDAVNRYVKGEPTPKIIFDFNERLARFGVKSPFPVRGAIAANVVNILDTLNPYKEVPEDIPYGPLGLKFSDDKPAICQVVQEDPGGLWRPVETMASFYDKNTTVPLKPFERLLRIDLSRKRSELISDFIKFLDRVDLSRNAFLSGDMPKGKLEDIADNYAIWEQDNTRFRKECWQHLKVWKMRRQKKSYAAIARELNIRIPAAKKSFARAFELIEGKKYDPELFIKYKSVNLPELKRTCDNCPTRSTCTELCPDGLRYGNQDYVPQQHLIPKNRPVS